MPKKRKLRKNIFLKPLNTIRNASPVFVKRNTTVPFFKQTRLNLRPYLFLKLPGYCTHIMDIKYVFRKKDVYVW